METNQRNGKVTVQIDRTPPPAVASLSCTPGENSIIMTASTASDNTGGSGIAEYMYFVDNKAGASDTIVRKTVGTDANPNTATFNTTIGRYLGQVAVVDKAGNVSNVTGNPDARTMMFKFGLYVPEVQWTRYSNLEIENKSCYCWSGCVYQSCSFSANCTRGLFIVSSSITTCVCGISGERFFNTYMPSTTNSIPRSPFCSQAGYAGQYLIHWTGTINMYRG